MTKVYNSRESSVEKQALGEKASRPLTWDIKEPCMSDSGDIGVNVWYYLHNGTKNDRGDQGQMEFFFEKEEFSPILKAVNELDSFRRVKELGRISSIRDTQFSELNYILCLAFDSNPKTDRISLYSDVQEMLFRDEECHERFRKLVKAETLLNLLKRPKVFYSEELQSLFT